MTKHSHLTRKQNGSAFTWVDLLLVTVIVALLIGIFLPAPSEPYHRSKSSLDSSNLRQIAVAMFNYAVDHDNALPHHPSVFEAGYGPSREVFINPYQDEKLIVDRRATNGVALRYGGYVLLDLGSNLDEIEEPQKRILGYTAKVVPEQDTRSVIFVDGHAEQWEEAKLRAALPPEVDVDALDGP